MNQQIGIPGASLWHATLFRLTATTLCLDAQQATLLLEEHRRLTKAACEAGIQPEGVVMAILAHDNANGEHAQPLLTMEVVCGGVDSVDRATLELDVLQFASTVVKLLDARKVLARAGVDSIDVSCDLPVRRVVGVDRDEVDQKTVHCLMVNTHIVLKAELAEGSFNSWQIETDAVLAMALAPRGTQFQWGESEALQALSAGAQVALLADVGATRHVRELRLFDAIASAPAYRVSGELVDASVRVGDTLIAMTRGQQAGNRYQFRDQAIGVVGQDGSYSVTTTDGHVLAVIFDSAA